MKRKLAYFLNNYLWLRRTSEIIGVEILISVLATLLYYTGFYSSLPIIFLTTLGLTVVYLVWTVLCLYRFRCNVNGKKRYYVVNLPIYAVLFAGAIVTGCLDVEPVYTFLFMPFKLFHFAAQLWSFPGARHMSRPVSAALTSIVIAIPVILIPFFLSTKRKIKLKGRRNPSKKEESDKNETRR